MHVTYHVAQSLDGFIADAGGGVGFLDALATPEGEDYGLAAFYEEIDALVMGRATYDVALSFGAWPYGDRPSWVFTHRVPEAPPERVEFRQGDPATVLEELAALGHERVWLVGGGDLAAQFQARDLVDAWVLSLVPVLLGAGEPVVGALPAMARLALESTRRFDSGLVQLAYRRA